ncbi:MAG: hypothetical protein IKV27_00710 [Lachnospiraceae bacterium]|nr:hypothetical protein [Lachnospiraceae bacterium]
MKILIDETAGEYTDILRDRFDSRLMLGQERYIGWCMGKVFSLNYYSGAEFMRRNYPIYNKAMGIIRDRDGRTEVSYHVFRGLTDPVSVIVQFLLTLLILKIVEVPFFVLFGLGWTIAVALLTWVCTVCSQRGQEGKERLDEFLSRQITRE